MPCKILTAGFGLLYLLAFLIFLISILGLFGQEPDPLSAAFVVILGQPWVRLADLLPEAARALWVALAPVVTLVLLRSLCRRFGRRQT